MTTALRTELSVVSPSGSSGPLSRSLNARSRVLVEELLARILLDDLVHLGQALEGVLAVEDAAGVGLVGRAAVREQRA